MGGGMLGTIPNLTDEQVFEWWTSKMGLKEWYAKNVLQQKLDLLENLVDEDN